MPGMDVKLGFVSFKRAKGIGPLKNFKHKLSGQYKDPIEVNKKFFKENPHLVQFAKVNPPPPLPKEDMEKVRAAKEKERKHPRTSTGKKSYLWLGKQFNGIHDRFDDLKAWYHHTSVEG